ncbi:MAG: hypothetical protein PSX37_11760 [bacterium]|nr:hypothetical protein [bacterium]
MRRSRTGVWDRLGDEDATAEAGSEVHAVGLWKDPWRGSDARREAPMPAPWEVLVKVEANAWWRGSMTEWRWIDQATNRWEGWVEYQLRDDIRRHWVAGDRLSPFPGTEVRDWLPVKRA